MAILIPIAGKMAFELDGQLYGPTFIMSMAAVLDGAIFGDHCSPISDTTVLSSISSDCNHLRHVKTQLPYGLFVGFLAISLGYLTSAKMGRSPVWFIVSFLIMAAALMFYGKTRESQTTKAANG